MRSFLGLILIIAFANATAQELFARKNIFSEYEPTIEKHQFISDQYTIGEYPLLKLDEYKCSDRFSCSPWACDSDSEAQ